MSGPTRPDPSRSHDSFDKLTYISGTVHLIDTRFLLLDIPINYTVHETSFHQPLFKPLFHFSLFHETTFQGWFPGGPARSRRIC